MHLTGILQVLKKQSAIIKLVFMNFRYMTGILTIEYKYNTDVLGILQI